jgi:hypothetical protein
MPVKIADGSEVFVITGRTTKGYRGFLCRAQACSPTLTQLLPLAHTETGFAVNTDNIKAGLRYQGREVHYFVKAKPAVRP